MVHEPETISPKWYYYELWHCRMSSLDGPWAWNYFTKVILLWTVTLQNVFLRWSMSLKLFHQSDTIMNRDIVECLPWMVHEPETISPKWYYYELWHCRMSSLGNDHLTWRGGGYGFFLKKYSDSQYCWKKIFWFWWRKKKSDSEFLSYNLMLNTGKNFRT
jgi:hypothetical protein